MKFIDADKLIAELTKMQFDLNAAYRHPQSDNIVRAISLEYDDVISLVTSLQEEIPDKDTIIRICKLHKAWSITAPWENIEDFVATNWNSKNIV